MSDYDFELERVLGSIRKSKAKRVGLQFPEGLKTRAVEIADKIEKNTDAKAIIFIDPTYGACDIKEEQCRKLGIDLLVHFGHTELKK